MTAGILGRDGLGHVIGISMVRTSLAALLVLGPLSLAQIQAADAQPPVAGPRPTGGTARPPADAPGPSGVVRQPLPPASSVARGPQLFERCSREAVSRRYRGAERRHFVRRCQLGYGRRLFRRRIHNAGPT